MPQRAPAAAAAALALYLAVCTSLASSTSATPDPQLPGNEEVVPGYAYVFLRFRNQLQVDVDECSAICQVEVGCVGWAWYRIGRMCTIGYQFSALPPLRRMDAISGRPAQVFSTENIDCTSQVSNNVDFLSLNQQRVPTQTVGECALACATFQSARCVAFTWMRLARVCHLKFSLTGATLPSIDAISALVGPCTAGTAGAPFAAGAAAVPQAQMQQVPLTMGGMLPLGGGGGGAPGGPLGVPPARLAPLDDALLAPLLGGGGGDGDGGGDSGDDTEQLTNQQAPTVVTRRPQPAPITTPAAGPSNAAASKAPANGKPSGQGPPSTPSTPKPATQASSSPQASAPATAQGAITIPKPGSGQPIASNAPQAPQQQQQQQAAPQNAAIPGGAAAKAAPAAAGGTRVVPAAASPAVKPASCRGLSLDVAFNNAVRDVNDYVKDSNNKAAVQFGKDLVKRREDVRGVLESSLKGAAPGDKKALQIAVEGAVQSTVPGALEGGVDVDGQQVSFPGLVWESMSTEPYVMDCY